MASRTKTRRPAKPFILKILCGLLIIYSFFYLLAVILYVSNLVSYQEIDLLEGVDSGIMMVVYGVLTAVFFAAAVGLWFLRPWAWRLTMILNGWLLVVGLWTQFSGDPSISNALGLVLNIFIVFYLVQSDIRALFILQAAAEEPAP